MVLDLFMGLVAMRLDNNLMMCFVLGVFILRAWASLSLMPEVTTEYSYRRYKYPILVLPILECLRLVCRSYSIPIWVILWSSFNTACQDVIFDVGLY